MSHIHQSRNEMQYGHVKRYWDRMVVTERPPVSSRSHRYFNSFARMFFFFFCVCFNVKRLAFAFRRLHTVPVWRVAWVWVADIAMPLFTQSSAIDGIGCPQTEVRKSILHLSKAISNPLDFLLSALYTVLAFWIFDEWISFLHSFGAVAAWFCFVSFVCVCDGFFFGKGAKKGRAIWL